MRLLFAALLLLTSVPTFAFPMMSTKEKVRLELWFHGVNSKAVKKSSVPKSQARPLPVELEQALTKF